MTPSALEALTSNIDGAFFLIAAVILVIELAEALFKRSLRGKTLWEMAVSASTQIPYLAVQALFLTGAYSLYWIIAYALPWQIPITVWSILAMLLLADFTY